MINAAAHPVELLPIRPGSPSLSAKVFTLDSNQRCTLFNGYRLLSIGNTYHPLAFGLDKKDPSRHDAQGESINQIQLATSLRKY